MDLNTIGEVARPKPGDTALDWRDGDAWLAGGTWLFSEPQPHLRRLIDLHGLGWAPLTVSDRGLEIAATCEIARLDGLRRTGRMDRRAIDRRVLPLVSVIIQDLEHRHRRRQRLHVAAGWSDDFVDRRARRRLHDSESRWRRAARAGRGFRHRQSSERSAAGRFAPRVSSCRPRRCASGPASGESR